MTLTTTLLAILINLSTPHVADSTVSEVVSWEGFRSQPYNDQVGHCTVGYGQLLHLGECTGEEEAVTQEEARARMRLFLGGLEKSLWSKLSVSINQNQFDALMSFGYNLGPSNMRKVIAVLNKSGKRVAGDKMLGYSNAGGKHNKGLAKRRAAERELFLK